MKVQIEELCELVSGELVRGDPEATVLGFASLEDASASQVSFYANDKFSKALEHTRAGIVVVSKGLDTGLLPSTCRVVEVADAAAAFDQIVSEYGLKPPVFVAGFAEGSQVSSEAVLNASEVSVQAGAVVLRGAKVGNATRINAGAVIGEDVTIGDGCEIGANVTIREGCIIGDRVIIHGGSVIGADGFGYEFEDGRHRKVDQMGIVRIEDDVEIGASTTIDRARFGETVIGEGTKVDNQVQIGHNAIIGKHCIIVAQCGISGSAKIGNYVTLGARVGIAGHIEIADRVTVGGKSGVIASITEPGGTYFGYPAKPIKETLRTKMRIKQLGGLLNRVKHLEKRLEALDESQ